VGKTHSAVLKLSAYKYAKARLNNDLKSERDWDYSELGGQAGKKRLDEWEIRYLLTAKRNRGFKFVNISSVKLRTNQIKCLNINI
jgi:hypothetical protein